MRLHASCVAYDGQAALILGRSGSGKSSLALQLMAYGAELVSDDQVLIAVQDGCPVAQPIETIEGRIEARFFGLLTASFCKSARIKLVLDLDQIETDRLPPMRSYNLLSFSVPLFHKAATEAFPAAILQYLKAGRASF